ncbi:MAG TPA: GWxTD domain-containing protein [Bacteroidia bacterium]|nr:GWxTD domain-containing protein [Bacteroidia bacterium]
MNSKYPVRIFFYFVFSPVIIFLFNCNPGYKISNQNLASLYDPEENLLHPQCVVYHFGRDSSRLFVKLLSSELLHKKNDAGLTGTQITISYRLYNDFESKLVVDSSSLILNDYDKNNSPGFFVHSINFKTPSPVNYILEAEVKDNFRQQSARSFIKVEKEGKQPVQNFLVKLTGQNVPLFRNYISSDETINILTEDLSPHKMFVRCYFRNFPLALPPFAEKIPVKFNYVADSIFTMEISPSTNIQLPKKGFYHFQYDTTSKQGLTIFRWEEDFPKITDASQAIEALRYLTTKKEYDDLLSAKDKKAAIDKYWLELSGNEERGKVLIRKYYTRIQDANKLFTSYLDGWKTDRGLIYTIYGPPTTVFKSIQAEDWTYGNFNTINSITFTFEKIYNPFSDNDYILRRSQAYETPWYRGVDRWRNGVVVND